jgi:hypothetical protein
MELHLLKPLVIRSHDEMEISQAPSPDVAEVRPHRRERATNNPSEETATAFAQKPKESMTSSPSPTEANDRGPRGRFAPGNRCARGNPHAKKVARLRAALLAAVSPRDLREVVAALLQQAKGGDVAATKELLQRLLGPPVELDLIERMDALEAQLAAVQPREGVR